MLCMYGYPHNLGMIQQLSCKNQEQNCDGLCVQGRSGHELYMLIANLSINCFQMHIPWLCQPGRWPNYLINSKIWNLVVSSMILQNHDTLGEYQISFKSKMNCCDFCFPGTRGFSGIIPKFNSQVPTGDNTLKNKSYELLGAKLFISSLSLWRMKFIDGHYSLKQVCYTRLLTSN